MTDTHTLQNSAVQPKNVIMVVYPDAHILDITGPLEIMSGVDLFLGDGRHAYDITMVGADTGPFRTSSGLKMVADKSFEHARKSHKSIDTLIISGGHGTQESLKDTALMGYVKWAASHADRVVSICTGAFILAELGLLNNRRATTHWWWCPVIREKYPLIDLDPDAIYIRDGKIWTSAGVTAGMDLALALVEDDWGHDIALKVARYNVMYMLRPGGQTQFSAQLIAQTNNSGPIAETMNYILDHVKDNLTVTALAARACMSERSFARKFKDETNMTPAQYVEAVRLQAARIELEQTEDPVDVVAVETGFGNQERMRRAFQRHMGIAATDYRERFKPKRF